MTAPGPERTVPPYVPWNDAAERYPDWRIEVTSLAGMPGLICADRQLILIDSATLPKEDATALAIAHLDLGHHLSPTGEFTEEQQAAAATLASIRLDREGSRG
jgi:hypothetical protein